MRIKEEESKRIGKSMSEYKTGPESPRTKKLNFAGEKIKSLPINRKQVSRLLYILFAFFVKKKSN